MNLHREMQRSTNSEVLALERKGKYICEKVSLQKMLGKKWEKQQVVHITFFASYHNTQPWTS